MAGLFEVQCYDFTSRYPCLDDIDPKLAKDMVGAFCPDVESSDDYEPSENETETRTDSATDENYEPQLGAININDRPSFLMVLTLNM
ncbi:hypothetical protein SASPL_130972 [Salvia splendens]|uniref:Uncharacterized protein n=1 Tax=Salvia splendens TaxID=180675 RepID=A0A8X8XA32_SALSN|nr:hypothetical protein SASPL_130972 [Salvia splendens]